MRGMRGKYGLLGLAAIETGAAMARAWPTEMVRDMRGMRGKYRLPGLAAIETGAAMARAWPTEMMRDMRGMRGKYRLPGLAAIETGAAMARAWPTEMVRDMRGMRGKYRLPGLAAIETGGSHGRRRDGARLGRSPGKRFIWGKTTKTPEAAHTCIYADWLYFSLKNSRRQSLVGYQCAHKPAALSDWRQARPELRLTSLSVLKVTAGENTSHE